VEEFDPGFTPDHKYVEILDIVKSVAECADIMDAKILVSGGRGIGGPDNVCIYSSKAESSYFHDPVGKWNHHHSGNYNYSN